MRSPASHTGEAAAECTFRVATANVTNASISVLVRKNDTSFLKVGNMFNDPLNEDLNN